ncbi:MAG: CinA family protein [Metamycoplasmataceae bacterium]
MKNLTFASIESFTGGMFASEIISIPGASLFFKGALVAYSNEVKEKLGIDTSHGVVNKEVAKQMAIKGKEYFNVDYCFSFTGNAGPSVIENKKIGVVFISINDEVHELKLNGSREEIRKKSVDFALDVFNKLRK